MPNNSFQERLSNSAIFWMFVIALFTFLVYALVYDYDFVNYDDNVYVTENPLVSQGLTVKGIVAAFTTPQNAGWNPLATISHMLDVQLFGMNAGAHHVV